MACKTRTGERLRGGLHTAAQVSVPSLPTPFKQLQARSTTLLTCKGSGACDAVPARHSCLSDWAAVKKAWSRLYKAGFVQHLRRGGSAYLCSIWLCICSKLEGSRLHSSKGCSLGQRLQPCAQDKLRRRSSAARSFVVLALLYFSFCLLRHLGSSRDGGLRVSCCPVVPFWGSSCCRASSSAPLLWGPQIRHKAATCPRLVRVETQTSGHSMTCHHEV